MVSVFRLVRFPLTLVNCATGEFVYGRGSVDNKSGLIGILCVCGI
jgi:acetylornithine deacetylase/succinyl-diaminopimelate desuccinylase-like protein